MSEYIAPRHIKDIEKVIKLKKLVVGFRKTGEDAINWIQNYEEIEKKPHTILDKSLKRKELPDHERYAALIPYRGKDFINGTPLGLYLSSAGRDYFKKNPSFGIEVIENKVDKDKTTYFISSVTKERVREIEEKQDERERNIVFSNLLAKLESFDIKDIAKYFITGDYDIHDLIFCNRIVPSSNLDDCNESPEKLVLNWLSSACMKGYDFVLQNHNPEWLKKFNHDGKSPIQHGCQYNYIAHMMNNEKGKALVLKVAGFDDDVAFYDGVKWKIVKNDNNPTKQSKDLQRIYNDRGIKLKWTWEDKDSAKEFLSEAGIDYIEN